jgi:DNA helicase-2/ATP-dependent DNA helicase PcrA
MYGTAIHSTLQIFFNKYREEQDLGEKDLIDLFEFNLRKTLLSSNDLKESLTKGKEVLSAYYKKYNGIWNRNLLTEYNIRGVHLNTGVFDLVLKGNIDKIEFYNEREVNVIDYKTGKRKSENKDNYKRQIIFYKILLDSDDKKKYIMKSGELDFIESLKKEVIEVTDNDIAELKALIAEKANEIYSLAFWDRNCDRKDCEFCKLSRSLVSEK